MSRASIGTRAPEFTAKNQHGEEIGLSALAGAPAVLVFYPFAFTGTCTGELAELQHNLDRFADLGARVVALSCDPVYSLRIFAEQQQLGFDLLSDFWPHGQIASRYDVFDPGRGCAIRGSFVLDADGVITWSVINQSGQARDTGGYLAALEAQQR